MVDSLNAMPELHVWGQVLHPDPLVTGLLSRVSGQERLYLEGERLGWREAWSVSAAADVGMVVYLQDAPQFRHMGIASNRLCMFLSMGVPVIATRQPSFEFIEEFDCGVLVDSVEQCFAALELIKRRQHEMSKNALRCAREYIDAPGKYEALKAAVLRVLEA